MNICSVLAALMTQLLPAPAAAPLPWFCHQPSPIPFIPCLAVTLNHLNHRSCLTKPSSAQFTSPSSCDHGDGPAHVQTLPLPFQSLGYSLLVPKYTAHVFTSESLTKLFCFF